MKRNYTHKLTFCRINMKGLSLYPNVPLTVLQRKGSEGAEVHVANPKSHSYNLTKTIRMTCTGYIRGSFHIHKHKPTIDSQEKHLTLGIFLEESRMFEGLMSLCTTHLSVPLCR